jgi:WD40 repeat protein
MKRPSRGLSSVEVRKLWRYAIASDFQCFDSSLEVDKQLMEYGTEDRFLPFNPPLSTSSLTHSMSSDGRLLAMTNKNNIDVYDLDSGEKTVISGHTSSVNIVGFSPTDPDLLVSWSNSLAEHGMRSVRVLQVWNGDIIISNVKQHQATQQTRNPIPIDGAAKAGVQAVMAHLGDTLRLSSNDSNEIQGAFSSILDRYDPRNHVPVSSRIDGSIAIASHSSLFSHSGEYLMYAPNPGTGDRNGSKTFDICLYRFADHTTTTLTGARDSIMWAGFSPDDSVIVSADWEGHLRVYDLDGQEICRWKAAGQIRTAIFSPDGKYLVTTNGHGTIKVWVVATGEELSDYDNGPRACWTLDWSPNGKYIIVGSESQGRVRLFTFNEGNIELVQERKLSMEKSDFKSKNSNVQRHLVGGFFGVRKVEFLSSPDGRTTSTRVAYSVSTDEGVEVFDFDKGKGWRFVPAPNADGRVATKAEDGEQAVLGHIWRKETGELGIIARDGIRFWRLD